MSNLTKFMLYTFLIPLFIIFLGIGCLYVYDKVIQSSNLTKEVKTIIDANYDTVISAEKGTLVKFKDFDLFTRGEATQPLYIKWKNWQNRKNSGGYITPTNHFYVKTKAGDVLEEIALQTLPFSNASFIVNILGELKTFTITNEGIDSYNVYQGDIDYARNLERKKENNN